MFWEKKSYATGKFSILPIAFLGPSLNYIKSFDGKKIEDKQRKNMIQYLH